MKKRKAVSLKSIVSLIAVILIMLLTQITAGAAEVNYCITDIGGTPYSDTDCDGITDDEESDIPQCSPSVCCPGIYCDAPKDLFVILVPCEPSNPQCPWITKLPEDPLYILTTAALDLHITVHQINSSQTCCDANSATVFPGCCLNYPSTCTLIDSDPTYCERNVTYNQKAVRIVEDTNTNGSILGRTLPPGTPNTAGDSTIFTQRIINAVDSLCNCGATSNCNTCVDALDGTIGEAAVIDKYIRHNIAHEVGHAMTLKRLSATDIGYHYPSQTNVILDSSVYYVKTGKKKHPTYNFYIGSSYYTGTDPQYGINDLDGATLR